MIDVQHCVGLRNGMFVCCSDSTAPGPGWYNTADEKNTTGGRIGLSRRFGDEGEDDRHGFDGVE